MLQNSKIAAMQRIAAINFLMALMGVICGNGCPNPFNLEAN
jgi:hypothetical protein